MPDLDAKISGKVIGDDWPITRPITNLPAEMSKAYFTVKEHTSDADVNAVFQKTITDVLNNNQGQITDTGADGTGSLTFFLLPADTVLMTPNREYEFDIQLVLSNGRLNTPERGKISGISQVTLATS